MFPLPDAGKGSRRPIRGCESCGEGEDVKDSDAERETRAKTTEGQIVTQVRSFGRYTSLFVRAWGSISRLRAIPRLLVYSFRRLLAQPEWQGVGAIAAIIIAVAIFLYTQSEAQTRREETIAHIQVTRADVMVLANSDASLSSDWVALIWLGNNGPARVDRAAITIVFGGKGVQPTGEPQAYLTMVTTPIHQVGRGTIIIAPQNEIPTYATRQDFYVEDILPGDGLLVLQHFRVDSQKADQLLAGEYVMAMANLSFPGSTITLDGILLQGDRDRVSSEFIKVICTKGERVTLTDTWFYPSILTTEGHC